MIALAVMLLVVMDAGFAGYRAAAGRNGCIDKRRYYARAVVTGLAARLIIALSFAGLAWAAGAFGGEHAPAFDAAGRAFLVVAGPYACAVLVAFVPFAVPRTDLRVLTSALLFGPLSLMRTWVIAAALLAGVWAAPDVRVVVIALPAAAVMLALQSVLDARQHS